MGTRLESLAAVPIVIPDIPPIAPFRRVKVVMPIQGEDMTLWPQKREAWWERILGSPFELRFFARDFMKISCDGFRVKIEPHYLESTFDTFWVDARGIVKAQALCGFFPFTLGDQKKLLRGLVVTLGAVPAHLRRKPEHAGTARLIEGIHRQLDEIEEQPVPHEERPQLGSLRAALCARVWKHKLRNWEPRA